MSKPPVLNAMTIDVEDYFHVSLFDKTVPRPRWDTLESRVRINTEHLLSLFEEVDIRATFFVLGWVAERFPDLIRRIAAHRHEIASHGYGHKLVYQQTRREFQEDVRRAKQLLEAATGVPVIGYRAPSFSITRDSLWALDVLIDEGYRYDASIFPIHHDRYGIPDSPQRPYKINRTPGSLLEVPGSLLEVPGSTVRVGPLNLPVAGGGYFRILPYSWTKWGIARINQESQPAIFYLHPWEIDPGQPRLPARWMGRFRHYTNLNKTESSLRRLLRDFRFGTLRNVLGSKLEALPSQSVT